MNRSFVHLLSLVSVIACSALASPAAANEPILEAGTSIPGVPAGIVDVATSDVDLDGDDDLILCGTAGLHWLDNQRDGTWTVRPIEVGGASVGTCNTVSEMAGPLGGVGRVLASDAGVFMRMEDGSWRDVSPAIAFTSGDFGDVDQDGALDLVVCGATSLIEPPFIASFVANWVGDSETGRFELDPREYARSDAECLRVSVEDRHPGPPRAFLITNLSPGSFVNLNFESFPLTGPGSASSEPGSGADFVFFDYDLDGDVDALSFGGGPNWAGEYRNNGSRTRYVGELRAGGQNWMALTDLDVDEREDIVFTLAGGPIEHGWYEDGEWQFEELRSDAPDDIVGTRAFDADLDGDPDLLIAHAGGVTYYENVRPQARPRWREEGAVTIDGWISARLAPIDFDGDGDDDLVVSNDGGGPIELLENTGDGSWPARRLDNSRNIDGDAVVGDLDGDGDPDMVISGNSQMYWWRNNGSDPWTATNLRAIAPAVFDIGDLDEDGDLDIVAVETDTGDLAIFTNDGSGSFAQISINVANTANHLAMVDLDGDGDLDVAIGGSFAGAPNGGILVLENIGGGGLSADDVWAAPREGLRDVVFDDFDRDGAVEALAIVSQGTRGFVHVVEPTAGIRDAWTSSEYGGREGVAGVRLESDLANLAFPEVVGWGTRGPINLFSRADGSVGIGAASFNEYFTSDAAALRMGDGSSALAVARSDVNSIDILPRQFFTVDLTVSGPFGGPDRPGVAEPLVVVPFLDVALRPLFGTTVSRLDTLGLRASLGGSLLDPTDWIADAEWTLRTAVYDDDSETTTYGDPQSVTAGVVGESVVLEMPDSLAAVPDSAIEVGVELSVALGPSFFDGPPDDLIFEAGLEGTTFSALGYDAAVTAVYPVRNSSAARIPVGNSVFAPANLELSVDALESIEFDATSSTVDLDGDDLLIARIASEPLDGRIEVVDSTTLRYTSLSEEPGTDAFVVVLTDGFAEVDVIGLVEVLPSSAPTANDATIVTFSDTPASFELDGSDRDDPTLFAIETLPSSGEVSLDDAETGAVTYTPDAGFVGTDLFTWTVSGGGETSRSATVTIQVRRTAPEDSDGDGTPDAVDNCPDVFNEDQRDLDRDASGDACDDDDDGDGIDDALDPCPLLAGDAADLDEDGLGDLCDDDDDGDDVPDVDDLCPRDADPDQIDTDEDAIGDVCDDDDDDDLVLDDDDNCPLVVNRDQWDNDEDGIGDLCDDDDDNDDVPDVDDVCPFLANPDQLDTDEDGIGDLCDNDRDSDGALTDDDCDDLDPSVRTIQTYYADLDEDGFGDPDVTVEECSSVPPEFYVTDDTDNCPDVVNPDQLDTDGDGIGDACDEDSGDTGVDAGPDAGSDAGMDAGSDAGTDAGDDAGLDAGSDAGDDTGPDTGSDAGDDSGIDTGEDVGPTEDANDDATASEDTATGDDSGTLQDGASADGSSVDPDADGNGEARGSGSKGGCSAAPGAPVWYVLILFPLAVTRRYQRVA